MMTSNANAQARRSIGAKSRTISAVLLALLLQLTAASWTGCSSSETKPTDPQIRQDVETSLAAATIEGVTVDVKNGVVTLSGEVESQAVADRVIGFAKGAKGVERVENELRVRATERPPDIPTAALRLALAANAEFKDVAATISGGVVTLTGTVPTDAAKANAEKVAKAVEGVTSVVNQITVSAAPAVAESCPDDQIKTEVETLIDRDFSDYLLTVSIESGKVTVRGAVKNQSEMLRITEALLRIKCVKNVDTSLLTVEGGEPDDKRIGSPAPRNS